MDTIKLVALGGLDENGRDCYVVEVNDDLFVFDCGVSFPDKDTPGIDYFIPNEDYLVENRDRIKAYILSHAHDETMGGILYLYRHAPAPVYCTLSTRAVLLAMGEFNGVKIPPFDFRIVDPTSTVDIAGHTFHFFQTAHNSPKSMGICLETDRGNIIYTSDFIVDYTVDSPEFYFDLNALSRIAEKPTLLLMTESKHADYAGYTAPKHRLKPRVEKYFSGSESRIFICLFYQNLYRLYEIFSLCKTYRKKIYPYDDFTRRYLDILLENDRQNVFRKEDLLGKEDLLRARQQDLVILMLGKETDLYTSIHSLAARTNPDKRIILNKDDTFIVAAVPHAIDESVATRSIDYLYRTGCNVVWLKSKQIIPMHPGQDDIKLMLSLLRPKYYIPVRGSFVNLMHNARLALSMGIGLNHSNVFVLDNGSQVVWKDDRVDIISKDNGFIHTLPSMVDGLGYIKGGDNELVQDRKKLSVDGVCVLAATVSRSKMKIVAGPDCQMRGFVFVKDAEPILRSVSNIFVEEVNKLLAEGIVDIEANSAPIEERIKRTIRRENGRDPLIVLSVPVVD